MKEVYTNQIQERSEISTHESVGQQTKEYVKPSVTLAGSVIELTQFSVPVNVG